MKVWSNTLIVLSVVLMMALLVRLGSAVMANGPSERLVSNVLVATVDCWELEPEPEPEPEPDVVVPTVSTQSVSSVDTGSASLHGLLSDDGGEACSVRFQVGPTVTYDLVTFWVEGKTSGDSFSVAVSELLPGTVYHIRAQAQNSVGTASGSDMTFQTQGVLLGEPVDFVATPGAVQIVLSWGKGSEASRTVVRGSVEAYPTTPTEGDPVYFGDDTSFVATLLAADTTYYYSAWSELDGVYSATYVTVSAVPTVLVAPPERTRSWWPVILGVLGALAVVALFVMFWHKRTGETAPPGVPLPEELPSDETSGGTPGEAPAAEEEVLSEKKARRKKGEKVKKAEEKKVEDEKTKEGPVPHCPKCFGEVISEPDEKTGERTCMSCAEVFQWPPADEGGAPS